MPLGNEPLDAARQMPRKLSRSSGNETKTHYQDGPQQLVEDVELDPS